MPEKWQQQHSFRDVSPGSMVDSPGSMVVHNKVKVAEVISNQGATMHILSADNLTNISFHISITCLVCAEVY